MERGSDKHGPRVDEQLRHETEGLVRGGHGTHAEEWKTPEPSAEGQPDADLAPDTTLVGGTPPGMVPDDVVGRSELATYLRRTAFPAVREMLVDDAIGSAAPDSVVEEVKRLPSGREFANVGEVWQSLGYPGEAHRF